MTINPAVAEGFLAWEAHGACTRADIDPEIFFPERHGRGRWAARALNLDIARAQVVCSECPVRRECRDKARRVGATIGIWGGVFLGTERRRVVSLYGIEMA